MKDLIFRIYALFFNFGAKLGIKKNRVGLVSMHNAHFADGLGEVERALSDGYEIIKAERTALARPLSALKFITADAFRLGRAKYIFLNDNFMALAYAKPYSETKIIQLWHGMGAFKKFGFDIDVEPKVRRLEAAQAGKLTHVACSSVGVKDIYAGAFGVSPDKVYPVGSPNGDYYFRNKEPVNERYTILYAPTFREDAESDAKILSHFDAKAVKDALGDVEILVRLHPQVHTSSIPTGITDVTDYPNVNELCAKADMLITDYSSICMDFVLQNKPVVFYAFDLDSYKGARDFYFKYEDYVPGPIAKTSEELAAAIKEARENRSPNYDEFRKFNFDEPEGDATAKLLEIIL